MSDSLTAEIMALAKSRGFEIGQATHQQVGAESVLLVTSGVPRRVGNPATSFVYEEMQLVRYERRVKDTVRWEIQQEPWAFPCDSKEAPVAVRE